MRVLITGALGTIGKPLWRKLEEKEYDVFGLDVKHSDMSNYARCDIREYRQLERHITDFDPDYVYHLAAEFGRHNGEHYYENLWSTNVIGTKNILNLQNRIGFNLLFASSSEIYGDMHVDPLKENDTNVLPISHPNDYAMTKWVNEQQIRNREDWKKDTMILRFFNAYGPGEYYTPYRSVVCLFCYRMLHNLPITLYKNYKRCFMYIDDFIETLSNCIERFHPGETINIAGTEHRDVADVVNCIQHCTGSTSLIELVGEESHNRRSKNADITKAINLLDHSPKILLEQGIQRTLEWMRQVYDIPLRV